MKKNIVRIAIATAIILLVPLVAMQFTDEVKWDLFDFFFMGILLFGSGLGYELIARKASDVKYRVAVGIAVVAFFLLVWINGAVGIIGNENNPANLMYFGVILVGIIGALVSRFKPRGMAKALFVTAFAQALVPVIALIYWKPQLSLGVLAVFVLNTFFVIAFIVSGMLFKRSTQREN